MNTTATLATVTRSSEEIQTDLFGAPIAARPTGGLTLQILSKKDPTKVLGRAIHFDALTLKEFKEKLADNSELSSKEKKKMRQQFLNGDAIKQRQMLGTAALHAAMQPDEFAPMGRVPDVLTLRKNGSLSLISVESFIGKDKTETPAQKIARLERELREAQNAVKLAAEASKEANAPEIETVETPAE